MMQSLSSFGVPKDGHFGVERSSLVSAKESPKTSFNAPFAQSDEVRRDFLGILRSRTGWFGQLAAKLLTLFHTWLINGLNPETLLEAFLNEQSKPEHNVNLDEFLPWKMSAARKRQFALPPGFKRPA